MNRAEHVWGKIPCSNPHLNSNPNPNSKKKQKRFHNSSSNGGGRYNDDFPSATQAASDDAYSFNQTSTAASSGFNHGGYLTYNLASYTRSELLELRKRLAAELEQIQNLRDQIDSGQFNVTSSSNNPVPRGKVKKLSVNNRRGALVGFNKDPKKPCNGFLDNGNLGVVSAIDCEGMLKECRQILTKLMKHKNGWIFNKPVDAAALGLHDYHQIVKQPMDLGTVKSNLAKNLYSHPAEFAADVSLTFNNALLYNPKTDQVNGMAEQLLVRFEELFRPIKEKIDSTNTQRRERELREFWDNDELQGSQCTNHRQVMASSPVRRGKKSKPTSSPIPDQTSKKPERMQVKNQLSSMVPPAPPPPSSPPVHAQTPSPVRVPLPTKEQKVGRVVTVKQPKPRAKDPNKREMSIEEKHKLGNGLQSLPQEKMPQLVQIVRKRNAHLGQDGDEIELDIEALDTETLWELDRFVTNWKKMVSKTKRQALMMSNNPAAAEATARTAHDAEDDMGELSEGNDMGKKLKKNEDEDVDIDDDMPVTSFPPIEIEKDEGGGGGGHDQGNASSSSSSSSSSSDSSSSSGSDSGSSSSSDSDADDAQS